LILVGLGLWVLIRALNANPHRNRFSRLKYVYFNKQRSLRRAEARKAKAEADLEAELKVLAEVSEQWDKRAQSYSQVSEAAKSVYRRALVNQQGAPEFTTEYLPEAKFKIKKSRKQRLMKSLKLGTASSVALVVALLLSGCSSGPKPEGMDVYLDDSQTYCELNVQKSPVEIPAQTVAILAPTN